jgi:small conductance mechanosensitive channel
MLSYAPRLAQDIPLDVEVCGPREDQAWFCRAVVDVTHSSTAGEFAKVISVPLTVVLIIVGAWLTNRIFRKVSRRIERRLERDEMRDRMARVRRRTGLAMLDTSSSTPTVRSHQRAATIGAGLRSLATFVIWAIAAVWILATLGANPAAILTGAGLIGVALGFGAQNLLRDVIAGTFMIIEDQFGVGDTINVGEVTGTVDRVSLRVTRLRDVNGVLWHFPNGVIQRVANESQRRDPAEPTAEHAAGVDDSEAGDVGGSDDPDAPGGAGPRR